MKAASRLHTLAFGAATLLSLGFGAAHAFASPAEAAARRACTTAVCHSLCVESGYSYGSCRDGRFCTCSMW
jgi:hypothetical protein